VAIIANFETIDDVFSNPLYVLVSEKYGVPMT
jgi:hypothetical protein